MRAGLDASRSASISSGIKNIALPISRKAPIRLARYPNVLSEICMPRERSVSATIAGVIAWNKSTIVLILYLREQPMNGLLPNCYRTR